MQEYNFYRMRWPDLRRAIKGTDPTIRADLFRFLEDDPHWFQSGYRKEIIWHFIRRYDLTADEIAQLERAALKYLRRPMTREFKLMCQSMARIATKSFWGKVETLLESDVPRVQVNAYCLYAYADGVLAGERKRLELDRLKYEIYWMHRHQYVSPWELIHEEKDLITLLHEPENWPDGVVKYTEANPDDQPLLHYSPSDGQEIATLDVAASYTDKMLQKLAMVLATGVMGIQRRVWDYAVYLLYRINDPAAVPIVIQFLHDKIDYKFDGPRKEIHTMAALKVLLHYGTEEALAEVEAHHEADQLYRGHYPAKGYGWLLSYPD